MRLYVPPKIFMVGKDSLEEFKKIWREEFGEEISDDFALAVATSFLSGFSHVYRPIKKEWVEEKL